MGPKAMAKGAPSRPAAWLRGGLSRPAAVVEIEADQKLRDLNVAQLDSLGTIRLVEALYYQRKVDLVGTVSGVKVGAGQVYMKLQVSGARDEALLKALTG